MVLTLINLLNYLDRYVVPSLLPAVQRDMGLSYLGLGALSTGFLVVYMCAAPFFGALGDRRSRTRWIALGVFFWSLATAVSGLARNYWELIAARGAVGIGEASYGTIAPALLADYFPLRTRGRMFAVFYMAIPVGSALGYVLGGLIEHWYSWRAAFFVAGIPGLALAAWVLRLPDPPRGIQDQAVDAPHGSQRAPSAPPTGGSSTRLSLRSTLALYGDLLKRAPYVVTVLGYAAYTFALGGLAWWMPIFLEQARGVSPGEATTGFGGIVVVTGFIGTFVGGWLGDYWLTFSRQAYLWMSGLVTLLAVPFAAVALMAHAPGAYYPALIAAELLLFMSAGPINSAIVNLVSPGERASAVALSVFTIHLLGDVFSPSIIGLVADRSSLEKGVLIVPVATALCAVLWFAAARAAGKAITTRT
jgi:MFS family permease